MTYNGIKYEVYVNNKKIMPNYSLGLLRVPLNKGINTLNIISKAQLSEYIFFVISIISTIMIILTLIMKKEIFDKKSALRIRVPISKRSFHLIGTLILYCKCF